MNTPASRRWPAYATALLLVVVAADASAQRVASSVDVTGMSMRYQDSLSLSGTSLSPAIRAEWGRGTLALSASYSNRGAAGSALEGSAGGSVFTPSWRLFLLEGAANLVGASQQGGSGTAQSMMYGRAHVMSELVGAWAGVGGGQGWTGSIRSDRRTLEAAVWMQRRALTALLTATPTRLADTTRYTDVQLAARWASDRVEFGASASTRSGLRGAAVRDGIASWGTVSATAWLASHVALVASAGSYPAEQAVGYPGGHVATVGIRLASHRNDAVVEREATRTDVVAGRGAEHPSGASSFSVTPGTGGTWMLRVHAPRATRVEVTGDFVQWHTLSMRPAGNGWWMLALPLARGSHEIEMRVDGGAWMAPPGLSPMKDEFGGTSGLLLVPR
jgi:hypothetical protein